jgi:hypothetical protein
MINLGDQVEDKLTNFKGTAIARAEYLYGCVWICVVPLELQDNKPVEDVWFDEGRLEYVEGSKSQSERDLMYDGMKRPGGPTPVMSKINLPKPRRGYLPNQGVV